MVLMWTFILIIRLYIVPKTSKDLAKIYNLEDYTIVDDKNIVSKIGSFKKENNAWIFTPKKVLEYITVNIDLNYD